MITLEVPSAIQGHATVIIDETDPNDRAGLAGQVMGLIRQGHLVFVREAGGQTQRVQGYQAESNSWILHRSADPNEAQIPADGTNANVVAKSAGG